MPLQLSHPRSCRLVSRFLDFLMFYLPNALTGSFTLNLLLRVKNLPHAMTMLLLMMTTMIMLRIVFKRKLFVLVSAVVFVVGGALHA